LRKQQQALQEITELGAGGIGHAFAFRHNADWEHNNILASLLCAADEFGDEILATA
jgi:hypothetical protein